MKELTGGKFRFIVATHVDKDHLHNHIIINSVDSNSDKKLKWDYKVERNLRMISDRFLKSQVLKSLRTAILTSGMKSIVRLITSMNSSSDSIFDGTF